MTENTHPGDFVLRTMEQALEALEQRVRQADGAVAEAERRIKGIRDEQAAAHNAVKEQRRAIDRQRKRYPGQGTLAPVPEPQRQEPRALPRRVPNQAQPRRASPDAPIQPGSNHEKVLAVLDLHPRGLNATAVHMQAGVPRGSISVVLSQLVERGKVVKVGRGFYRLRRDEDAAAA
jgi:hypothetical protein